MDEEKFKKLERISDLFGVNGMGDDLLIRYFDHASEKLLDEKIEVLTALKEGKPIGDIPKFFDILELMPKDGIWD